MLRAARGDIGVLVCISAPFCPTNDVGILSLVLQRLAVAAKAEYLPWGRVSSNVPTGTSGTALNVLEVTFVLLLM